MAVKPTPGGSDGTYGAELNAFLDESLAADGKIKDGAEQMTSAAPTTDVMVANKKYVDDVVGLQDRGDPAAVDFAVGDLIADGLAHELDLSGIVASGAATVLLRVRIEDNAVGSLIVIKENGNSNQINAGVIRTQVSGVTNDGDMIISLDANRKANYITTNTTFTILDIIVKGWWF